MPCASTSWATIHADETPVALLAPGKGKTHRAYVWVYRTTTFAHKQAVWFDFCTGRGGEHPRRVLGGYAGTVVTDDYSGYKAVYAQGRIIEAGSMAAGNCTRPTSSTAARSPATRSR